MLSVIESFWTLNSLSHWLEGAKQAFLGWTDCKNLSYQLVPVFWSQHKTGRLAPTVCFGRGIHRTHISLHFVIGLPLSQGKTTILLLTIIDRFSKASHFIPLDHLRQDC